MSKQHRSSWSGSARGSSRRDVSPARLQQRSGAGNAFGGWQKVDRGDGTFRMSRWGR